MSIPLRTVFSYLLLSPFCLLSSPIPESSLFSQPCVLTALIRLPQPGLWSGISPAHSHSGHPHMPDPLVLWCQNARQPSFMPNVASLQTAMEKETNMNLSLDSWSTYLQESIQTAWPFPSWLFQNILIFLILSNLLVPPQL